MITKMERLHKAFPIGFPKSRTHVRPVATENKVRNNAFLNCPIQSKNIDKKEAIIKSI